MFKIEITSDNPKDYIECAYALEKLSYHNMDMIDKSLRSTNKYSEQIQYLLEEAIKLLKSRNS